MEFQRKATDPDRIVQPVELPEGHAILIADAPDYVNLPQELVTQFNLNTRATVISVCYKNFNGQELLHYKLDVKINGQDLWVAKGDQFYWHTR